MFFSTVAPETSTLLIFRIFFPHDLNCSVAHSDDIHTSTNTWCSHSSGVLVEAADALEFENSGVSLRSGRAETDSFGNSDADTHVSFLTGSLNSQCVLP